MRDIIYRLPRIYSVRDENCRFSVPAGETKRSLLSAETVLLRRDWSPRAIRRRRISQARPS